MTTVENAAPLSDDQIERLLQEAEGRLREREQSQDEKSLVPHTNASKQLLKSTTDITPFNGAQTTKATVLSAQKPELSVRAPGRDLSKQEKAEKAKTTAGPGWGNMPRTNTADPSTKRVHQLLAIRDVLDPKRHYKKDTTRAKFPEYSQIGTLVEGATEFFSARMTKKERKKTLVEEVLDAEDKTRRFKNKYGEIQEKKQSGKKGHYKKMMEKRYGKNYVSKR